MRVVENISVFLLFNRELFLLDNGPITHKSTQLENMQFHSIKVVSERENISYEEEEVKLC